MLVLFNQMAAALLNTCEEVQSTFVNEGCCGADGQFRKDIRNRDFRRRDGRAMLCDGHDSDCRFRDSRGHRWQSSNVRPHPIANQ